MVETIQINELGYTFDAGQKFITIQPAEETTLDENGWNLQLSAGDTSNGSGSGGGVNIEGGDAADGNGGGVSIQAGSGEVGFGGSVTISAGFGGGGAGIVAIDGFSQFRIDGLPTSDPGVATALWNDGGTLKISAG